MNRLSVAQLAQILSYFPVNDVLRLRLTSRRFNEACKLMLEAVEEYNFRFFYYSKWATKGGKLTDKEKAQDVQGCDS